MLLNPLKYVRIYYDVNIEHFMYSRIKNIIFVTCVAHSSHIIGLKKYGH